MPTAEALVRGERLCEGPKVASQPNLDSVHWCWSIDRLGRITDSNSAVEFLLGFRPEEIIGGHSRHLVHPDDWELVEQRLSEVSPEPDNDSIILRIKHKNGSYRHIESRGTALLDSTGDTIGFQASCRDVTAPVDLEAQLEKQTACLEELFEQAPEAIALLNTRDQVIRVNWEFTRLFGYSQEESFRKPINELIAPGDLAPGAEELTKEVANGRRVEREAFRQRKDGTRVYVSVLAVPVVTSSGQIAEYVIYRNVGERLWAIQALLESEARNRAFLDNSPNIIFLKDIWGRYLLANKEFEKASKVVEKDIRGRRDEEIFSPQQAAAFRANDLKVIESGVPMEFEEVAMWEDGPHTSIVFKFPLKDAQGHVYAVGGVATDITARKKAEEELRRNEAYLEEGQRLSHTGSWSWNAITGEVFWSRETYRIFGLDPATTKPSREIFFNSLHPADYKTFPTLKNVLRNQNCSERDYRIVLPDGSVKFIHGVTHFVRNVAGEVVELVGTVMDVTAQNQAKNELQRAFDEIKALKDRLYEENLALKDQVDRAWLADDIVGDSPALRRLLDTAAKVAPTDSTVLILGETGTGKELIARAIHKGSQRASGPFLSVNCAALPQSLIASELFGHEKGAFTGASQRRQGRFESADGGTIFLDEVGELPPETQIALLRVIQEREFSRVGGTQSIPVNVRVIAATNRDLQSAIAAGAFRADLFYRLNVFPIEAPPLRDRAEDIPLLVRHFAKQYAKKLGKRLESIERKTLDLLSSYSWPGNIRELQNVIERSVILCDSDVLSVDERWFGEELGELEPVSKSLSDQLEQHERHLIEAELMRSRGRVAGQQGAAAILGVPVSTLESRIKTLKIDKSRFRAT
jgi:PAS domain S-box-containing protein